VRKAVMVCLSVLVPVAVVGVLSLCCVRMELVRETDMVFADSTTNYQIPARGYSSFKMTVTPEMMEVKDHKDVFVYVSGNIYYGEGQVDLIACIMTEDNFYAFEQNLPYECLKADTSRSWPSAGATVTAAGDYYAVLNNRADPDHKTAKVYALIQHWAMVPK
jgi:hypothetical protein